MNFDDFEMFRYLNFNSKKDRRQTQLEFLLSTSNVIYSVHITVGFQLSCKKVVENLKCFSRDRRTS